VWEDVVANVPAGGGGGKRAITVPSWDVVPYDLLRELSVESELLKSPSASFSDSDPDSTKVKLKDVVIGVLPASVSRHNCPAAPFAVDSILAVGLCELNQVDP
jgi:hypothetical protein